MMGEDKGLFKEHNTLVSIILAVWNPQPDWLAEAIDSAFKESRCKIEVILVDDGSDESPDVWLATGDVKRVRLVRIQHRGLAYAQNVGLAHARGEFIRFLDGDDVILPESTSMLLDLTQGESNIVTYGSTIVCDSALRPYGRIQSHLRGKIHLQTALGYFTSTMPTMLIPRRVAIQIGCDERLIVQNDWDFVLRVSEVANFLGMKQPVYLYRRHESSLSSGNKARRRAIRSTVLIIKGYLERHPELHGTRAEGQVRAYAQFLIAKLWNPQFPMRSQRFWKATAVDPIRGALIASTRVVVLGMRVAKRIFSARRNLFPHVNRET
jgi:glycosyltransferase involved in cell wall biosynthesis